MQKEDWKNILMVVATLVVSIISLGFFNLFTQFLFVIIFVLICILAFSYLNNKAKGTKILLIGTCIAEVSILGISLFVNGSPVDFGNRIKSIFVTHQEDADEISSNDLETYLNTFSGQIAELDKKLEDTNQNIGKLDDDLVFIENNLENIQFNHNIDEIEIDTIVKQIESDYENHSESFSELKIDIYSIELFYKLFIADEPYYYCNILEAFERYGVNVEKFGLDENVLFMWDIEILYARYNIKQKNLSNLCLDANAKGEDFKYNDYRVTLQKYSDTFDYGGWRLSYGEYTAEEADTKLNNFMMDYYKKFVINFSNQ